MKASGSYLIRVASTGVLCASAFVVGCGQQSGQSDQTTSSKQFPGYQQVGGSGDAAQLWFNPTDIARAGSGYVIHALKAFQQGYARFDVVTNCRDSAQRLAGTQYRADGTADKEYPGNDGPVPAKSEPGMSELMSSACAVAMASRAISGAFNVPAALELLYGPYDANTKAATWQDASIPSELPWRDNLALAPGKSLLVTGLAAFDLSEDGKQKKVLVTNAVPDGGGCYACTGLLGIAIFTRDGEKWKVESSSPYVASMGANGSVGDHFEWVPAGDKSYALVVYGQSLHQGYVTAATDAFLRGRDGTFVRLLSDADTAESEQEQVSVQTTFLKGKNPAHYDVKVGFSYEIPGRPRYFANHVYQFADGKYVPVRKDDPPKFGRPDVAESGEIKQSSAFPSTPAQAESGSHGPAVTPSFDCSKARSDSEHLICSDAQLAADDVELAAIFTRAKAVAVDQAAFKQRVRQQWNYRERNCHDRECLIRWYADQKVALNEIARTGRVDSN